MTALTVTVETHTLSLFVLDYTILLYTWVVSTTARYIMLK